MELQKFWNTLNTAFTWTLNAKKGLWYYDKLKSTFSAIHLLVPPIGHTQINQGMNAYENYTKVLRDDLLKKYTINKETSLRAFRNLTRNQLSKDGFDILTQSLSKAVLNSVATRET